MRICTGIEYDRDHCRVEKMGCVGCCYYNEKEKKIDNLDKGKMLTLPDNRKYIPVSLVEKNIEDLNKKEQELQNSISTEEKEEYSDTNISFLLMDIEIRRSTLQALLKGGENEQKVSKCANCKSNKTNRRCG